ncbi:MAG TPA: cytochrome o ubiquinol oxidase subunit IV [Candidatus Saccharimonadales bacterium]|jgi:cytochrome o ubiquinol oxidase operon protein cyoD|nr:cytochrome o ubiquinol oxidase subunit IV [Candidatus Saccharimonadales bacterium]
MIQLNETTKHVISYAVGFILSIALTVFAYALAVNDTFRDKWSPTMIAIVLAVLASIQLVVQLLFFLHLGSEPKPRWKLVSFIFAFIVLGIIVFGSLWIMFDLNSRMMMSPTDMMKYMNRQSGV